MRPRCSSRCSGRAHRAAGLVRRRSASEGCRPTAFANVSSTLTTRLLRGPCVPPRAISRSPFGYRWGGPGAAPTTRRGSRRRRRRRNQRRRGTQSTAPTALGPPRGPHCDGEAVARAAAMITTTPSRCRSLVLTRCIQPSASSVGELLLHLLPVCLPYARVRRIEFHQEHLGPLRERVVIVTSIIIDCRSRFRRSSKCVRSRSIHSFAYPPLLVRHLLRATHLCPLLSTREPPGCRQVSLGASPRAPSRMSSVSSSGTNDHGQAPPLARAPVAFEAATASSLGAPTRASAASSFVPSAPASVCLRGASAGALSGSGWRPPVCSSAAYALLP